MSSPIVILNPAAGRGARSWPRYEAEILKRGGQIRATQRAGETHLLTLEAINEGAEIIVAAGGDGTLSEVAGAVVESQRPVRLGVLPIGTGNDFARTLGVWGDPQKAIDAIFEGHTRRIDVGCIEAHGTKRTFINIAGCGFDSLVARRINAWGQRKTMRCVRGLSKGVMQRIYREMMTASNHFTINPNIVGAAGREIGGVWSERTWQFYDLIERR